VKNRWQARDSRHKRLTAVPSSTWGVDHYHAALRGWSEKKPEIGKIEGEVEFLLEPNVRYAGFYLLFRF
jgi:hypothetical protein